MANSRPINENVYCCHNQPVRNGVGPLLQDDHSRLVRGVSILELIIALTITLVIGLAGFQMFRQNERLFLDQNQVSETQQNLRAVLFQINDDIERAGEGVPLYAASFDSTANESLAA